MTTRKINRLLAALCCAVLLCLPVAGLAQEDVTMDVTMGYNGVATYVRKLPVTVTLENHGPDLQGTLSLDVNRSGAEYDRYQMPVSVASGASVQVTLPVVLTQKQKTYTLRLLEGDRLVCETAFKPETVLNPYNLVVGTLSRNAQDLQYMSISQGADPLARGEYWTPVALDASTFPSDAESLRFFDLLVVDGFDLTTLSQQQQEAADAWLKNGGIFIVGGGANARQNFAFFQPYTGITAGSVTDGQNVSGQLMSLLGVKGDGMGEITTQVPLNGAKGAPFGEGPLVDAAAVGDGYVLTASFSLCEKPLAQWLGRNVIWQRILLASVQTRYQAIVNQRSNGSYDNSGVFADSSITSNVKIPNARKAYGPAVLLAAFALLAGVGGYLVLKKLDKREWMWALAPALAALSALGMWLFSLALPIRDPIVVRYSLLQVDENGYTDGYTVVSAAKAEQGPMTLTLNEGTIDMAATAGYYANASQDDGKNNPATLRYTYAYGAQESLTCQNDHPWNINTFVVRGAPMKDASGISVQCGWDGENLTFTITNQSAITLSEGVVLSGYGYVSAPGLLPGQTVQCSLKPAPKSSTYANTRYPDWYNQDWNGVLLTDEQRSNVSMYEMTDNYVNRQRKISSKKNEWVLRGQLLNNVSGQIDRFQVKFCYAAFSDELDGLQVSVDGRPVQRQAQRSCVLVQAHYNPVAADGTARFLSNSFPVSAAILGDNQQPVVGESVQNLAYQTFSLSVDQTFAIDMRALPDQLTITGFDVGSQYSYYAYNVSLYNPQTGQWDAWKQFTVDRSTGRGSSVASLPDLDTYLVNGFLFARFEKGGSEEYADVSVPVVTVEGRVK